MVIRRIFGTTGNVYVDYEITKTEPEYVRIEHKYGTLTFLDGIEEITLTLKVFKRQYYESDDRQSIFIVYLFNPQQGAEIGD